MLALYVVGVQAILKRSHALMIVYRANSVHTRDKAAYTPRAKARGTTQPLVEFRCFILERTLMTLSPYLREGELAQIEDGSWPAAPEEVEEAARFLHLVLADAAVALPPAVVLDVGKIRDKGWAIIEANAAWGSGIYGCSPVQVLRTLQRATLKDKAVTPADRPWVRPLPDVQR